MSQRHLVHNYGFTSNGEVIAQGEISPVVFEWFENNAIPVVESLSPDTAVIGGADLTLHVIGVNFTSASTILFNGGLETTTFVSATELTTIVKPSLASAAITVPVAVQTGPYTSNAFGFAFTEA